MNDRLIIPGGPRVVQDPDGSFRMVGVEVERRTIDLKQPGTASGSYRITGEDLLLSAARMRRDGMTLPAIRKELEVMPHVSDKQLETFLTLGLKLLDERIAQGVEPAESVHKVVMQVADMEGDDEP